MKNDIDFAYKVRHALNEKIEKLPDGAADRLAAARSAALARKKKESPRPLSALRRALSGQRNGTMGDPFVWAKRVGVAVPVLVVMVGLAGIYQAEEKERVKDLADIDAAVLSDDLPLTAYTDHGFNAYLSKRAD